MELSGAFYTHTMAMFRCAIHSVRGRDLARVLGASEPYVSRLKRSPNPTVRTIQTVLDAVATIKAERP